MGCRAKWRDRGVASSISIRVGVCPRLSLPPTPTEHQARCCTAPSWLSHRHLPASAARTVGGLLSGGTAIHPDLQATPLGTRVCNAFNAFLSTTGPYPEAAPQWHPSHSAPSAAVASPQDRLRLLPSGPHLAWAGAGCSLDERKRWKTHFKLKETMLDIPHPPNRY